MLLAFMLILLVLLGEVRRQRKEALVLEYQYRLFQVRDKLRELGMEDPNAARSWLFPYLDSTITKSIGLLHELSVWHLFALMAAHRKDEGLAELRKRLEKEFTKPNSQRHKEIETELMKILGEFVIKRHVLLVIISAAAIIFPVAIAAALEECKKRSLELVLESPETSTLGKFAPAT